MNKVAEVLDGLREEERRLSVELSGVRRAIAALEEVTGIVPVQEPEALPPTAGAPSSTTPPGPYATSGFYEAAAAYLEETGEPRSLREIAEALLAGGYLTRARNFSATARTMLQRRLSANAYGIYATENGAQWFFRE